MFAEQIPTASYCSEKIKEIFKQFIEGDELMQPDVPIDYIIPPERDCARYKMHKYWAGKPWYVVSEYINHYTKEGEIVLDPFCGSGVVGCEALISRRKVILNDINPVAAFIAGNTCRSPIDIGKFQEEFEGIKLNVKDEIMDMYKLQESCEVCGNHLYAKHVIRGPATMGKWIVEGRCPNGHGRDGRVRRCLSDEEKAEIAKIESRKPPFWFPEDEFPDGREIMRLKNAGITRAHELFTSRNLTALSILYHEIQRITDSVIRELMFLAFSNTVLHVSKLKSEQLRPMSANSYYCMDDWIEENVWQRFENRVYWHWGVYEGKKETNLLIGDYYRAAHDFREMLSDKTFLLFSGPAQNLSAVPDSSIDYCFTDPPYGGSIQYSELTLLWRYWLKMKSDFIHDEIIVNDFQSKKEQDFEHMLKAAFAEIYRVLRPGRWLSVTFNNRNPRIWIALLKACEDAGFDRVNVIPQKPVGKSFVQSWTGNSLKRDLVINFRKPDNHKTHVVRERNSDDVDVENIIISSTKDYLSKKEKASLSELFEEAIMKWMNQTRTICKKHVFDMEVVDSCLKNQPQFLRIEDASGIFYCFVNNEKA
jgi:DNA modification methylase